jgi:hypothetical protein
LVVARPTECEARFDALVVATRQDLRRFVIGLAPGTLRFSSSWTFDVSVAPGRTGHGSGRPAPLITNDQEEARMQITRKLTGAGGTVIRHRTCETPNWWPDQCGNWQAT